MTTVVRMLSIISLALLVYAVALSRLLSKSHDAFRNLRADRNGLRTDMEFVSREKDDEIRLLSQDLKDAKVRVALLNVENTALHIKLDAAQAGDAPKLQDLKERHTERIQQYEAEQQRILAKNVELGKMYATLQCDSRSQIELLRHKLDQKLKCQVCGFANPDPASPKAKADKAIRSKIAAAVRTVKSDATAAASAPKKRAKAVKRAPRKRSK